jgi:hypothetical protein
MSNLIAEQRIKMVMAASDVVSKLDASIRADAFRFLLQGNTPMPIGSVAVNTASESTTPDLAEFFKDRRGGNPAANAVLVAGYLFSVYGDEPFEIDEVRQLAKQVGLVVPTRLDMTFVSAQRDGRSLFNRAGTGKFRPTVNGELNFQREGIAKGSRTRSAIEPAPAN